MNITGMARVLVISIGEYAKEINKNLKASFLDYPHIQFNFSFIDRNNDDIYRLYQATISGSYRCIISDISTITFAKKISHAGLNQIFIIGHTKEQAIAEAIIYTLAHLKKSRVPFYSIIVEPFHADGFDSVHKARILFQFLKITFGNVHKFDLEEFQFLYRNDPFLTMKLIVKEITKIIENKLQL